MKKLTLFIALITALSGKSQLTLQIGSRAFTGLSTNTYGIMNSWSGVSPFERGNRNATIYPLQSIGIIPVNSQITALKFYRDVLSGQPAGVLQGSPRFKLYVKNTTLTTFATAVTWQDTANTMLTVFDGDPTAIVGNTSGWVTFTLPTPLIYSGNNLMILLEYWQTAAATPSVVWSYDNSSVSPQVTADYFDATQNRYNSPVTTLPFAANTTGSNIRHPSLQIVYTEAPIPVKLASFDAVKRNTAVQLNWATSLETGTTVFDVQKSNDAVNWNNIATVPAFNTSNGAAYQHIDNKPGDINFYRLKITEDNGKVYYSATKKVSFAKNNIFTVSPSPAHNFIQVSFPQKTRANIQMISSAGAIVKQTGLINTQSLSIDISDLPAGIYLVRDIISAASKKIVIE
jgi:hypothetical protein